MAIVKAWHFCGKKLRDGRDIPADGEWIVHDGPKVIMCESGLHASRRVIDALQYAPGSTVCRVSCKRIVEEEKNDKLVCWERRIDWRIENADDVLRAFARKTALSVIDLWDAPAIVREYLETGNEALRMTAKEAAWSAARRTTNAVASCAARAAGAVAWNATLDAGWDAALAAARSAASAAAWESVSAAERDAASAAMIAARSAPKINEFNTILEQMLDGEHKRISAEAAS